MKLLDSVETGYLSPHRKSDLIGGYKREHEGISRSVKWYGLFFDHVNKDPRKTEGK